MLGVKDKILNLASENIAKTQAHQEKLLTNYNISIWTQGFTEEYGKTGITRRKNGPYEILEELGRGVYKPKNMKTQKVLEKIFNFIHFKIYHLTKNNHLAH